MVGKSCCTIISLFLKQKKQKNQLINFTFQKCHNFQKLEFKNLEVISKFLMTLVGWETWFRNYWAIQMAIYSQGKWSSFFISEIKCNVIFYKIWEFCSSWSPAVILHTAIRLQIYINLEGIFQQHRLSLCYKTKMKHFLQCIISENHFICIIVTAWKER